ncbi:hypothetical protein MPTK1_2g16390 [Marchantia polymorpha subsp. ruderalis]|uniref:Uncharacterized protein n=1 Tax=Marchantia polymorpha TaxID=3197 RepID=A0A2R6W9S0_MARPO|nr:hypothetical protein MARPO_0122s0025 [Marchantia polymorpha]BBN02575.1 hypothetical protein Mp_2g16390 [Marchantia polymorpha subsp. ruderalis]|eukprot:PTQ30594.1 hypothetical protein MARPO_0122s0025 [Marchantia polymorpha]
MWRNLQTKQHNFRRTRSRHSANFWKMMPKQRRLRGITVPDYARATAVWHLGKIDSHSRSISQPHHLVKVGDVKRSDHYKVPRRLRGGESSSEAGGHSPPPPPPPRCTRGSGACFSKQLITIQEQDDLQSRVSPRSANGVAPRAPSSPHKKLLLRPRALSPQLVRESNLGTCSRPRNERSASRSQGSGLAAFPPRHDFLPLYQPLRRTFSAAPPPPSSWLSPPDPFTRRAPDPGQRLGCRRSPKGDLRQSVGGWVAVRKSPWGWGERHLARRPPSTIVPYGAVQWDSRRTDGRRARRTRLTERPGRTRGRKELRSFRQWALRSNRVLVTRFPRRPRSKAASRCPRRVVDRPGIRSISPNDTVRSAFSAQALRLRVMPSEPRFPPFRISHALTNDVANSRFWVGLDPRNLNPRCLAHPFIECSFLSAKTSVTSTEGDAHFPR